MIPKTKTSDTITPFIVISDLENSIDSEETFKYLSKLPELDPTLTSNDYSENYVDLTKTCLFKRDLQSNLDSEDHFQ